MENKKYYCMSIGGDCSCLGYLGKDRIRGPVDNVLTVTDKCVKALIENTYLDKILNETPTIIPRTKGYDGDSEFTYTYSHASIMHHNPLTAKYRDEVLKRVTTFNNFLQKVRTEDNYFLTMNLNMLDLSPDGELISDSFENTLKYLTSIGLIDKLIVVGTINTSPVPGDIWQNAHLNNIQKYIDLYHFKYIEIIDNHWYTDDESCIEFYTKLDSLLNNKDNNVALGIISWLPSEEKSRNQRIERLNRLMKQVDTIFPNIPVIFIAQNWKDYKVESLNRKIITYKYDKLGIKGARETLRQKFIHSTFNYLIMFDDDAIIQEKEKDGGLKYLKEISKHKDGFCFLQYDASQLSGCAISKYIYKKEPMVDVSAEKNEGYEDTIWSHLLKYKYSQHEFKCNTIKCIHFQNPNETAPSTWSDDGERDWKQLTENTYKIVDYIKEHKDIPNLKVFFECNEFVNRKYTYERYTKDKKQKLVDLLVSRYPDRLKDFMRDKLEKAHGLK